MGSIDVTYPQPTPSLRPASRTGARNAALVLPTPARERAELASGAPLLRSRPSSPNARSAYASASLILGTPQPSDMRTGARGVGAGSQSSRLATDSMKPRQRRRPRSVPSGPYPTLAQGPGLPPPPSVTHVLGGESLQRAQAGLAPPSPSGTCPTHGLTQSSGWQPAQATARRACAIAFDWLRDPLTSTQTQLPHGACVDGACRWVCVSAAH